MVKTKNRIVIKISGESLADENGIYCQKKIQKQVEQIKLITQKGYQIIIIIGGGNIWRGKLSHMLNIPQARGDYMGMLATVMNGIIFSQILIQQQVSAKLFSAFNIDHVVDGYNIDAAVEALNANNVVLIAGGTGWPFFTTDTGASLRASELGANLILMGKNGVDGVYSADPNTDKSAKWFSHLTYDQAINQNLQVMDQTAFTMCKHSKIKIYVFDANQDLAYLKCLEQKIKFTVIE